MYQKESTLKIKFLDKYDSLQGYHNINDKIEEI